MKICWRRGCKMIYKVNKLMVYKVKQENITYNMVCDNILWFENVATGNIFHFLLKSTEIEIAYNIVVQRCY